MPGGGARQIDISHGPATAASARSVDDRGDELAVDNGDAGFIVTLEVAGEDGLAVAGSVLAELGVAIAMLDSQKDAGDGMGA